MALNKIDNVGINAQCRFEDKVIKMRLSKSFRTLLEPTTSMYDIVSRIENRVKTGWFRTLIMK